MAETTARDDGPPLPLPVPLPLVGIRVLDLSRVLAGPWCAMCLGDLGADVIKVEHPERGDDTRDWGLRTGATNTSYFDSANRNKRSITLDLATPEGLAAARDLARTSDVVVQNFKTGGADRLGLGYAALSAENPRLIYCSISGYASDGPEATRPGYDIVVQGEAGLMALNGEAERPPLKFGLAAVDLFTGQYAAQGVLAALVERERTGRGRHIELALFDCGVALTAYCGLEAMVRGHDPVRAGNAHPSIAPYGVFETGDGPIVLAVGNNGQYRRLCEQVLGRLDLATDPCFATNLERSRNRALFLPVLEAEFARWTRADLIARLNAAGIPCGEVLGLHAALTSDRARAGHLVLPQGNGDAKAHVLAPPYRLDGARLPVRRMPPALGDSNAEIQAERDGAGAPLPPEARPPQAVPSPAVPSPAVPSPAVLSPSTGRFIIAEPLTQEAFAPFGTVVDKAAVAPRPMNAGRARRFHDLAEVVVSGDESRVVIGHVEAEPYALPLALSLVERHPLGAQAFVPLNAAPFLVLVCPDEGGKPGRPRVFVTAPGQGICYAIDTWHGVLTPLGEAQEFLVIDRGGPGPNLEEYVFDEPWMIQVPDRA